MAAIFASYNEVDVDGTKVYADLPSSCRIYDIFCKKRTIVLMGKRGILFPGT